MLYFTIDVSTKVSISCHTMETRNEVTEPDNYNLTVTSWYQTASFTVQCVTPLLLHCVMVLP